MIPKHRTLGSENYISIHIQWLTYIDVSLSSTSLRPESYMVVKFTSGGRMHVNVYSCRCSIPHDSNRALELVSHCVIISSASFSFCLICSSILPSRTDGITYYILLQVKYIDYLLATAPPSTICQTNLIILIRIFWWLALQYKMS